MTHVIYTIAFAATDVMFLKPYYWKYQVTEKLRDQVIITGSQVSNASVQRYLNAKGIDKSFTAPWFFLCIFARKFIAAFVKKSVIFTNR